MNKKELLKMSKVDLLRAKWDAMPLLSESKDSNTRCYDCSRCSYCSYCFDCSQCVDCFDCSQCVDCSRCSYCSYCFDCSQCVDCSRCSQCVDCFACYAVNDGKKHQYLICNVQFTKEEYEKKMKELQDEQERES